MTTTIEFKKLTGNENILAGETLLLLDGNMSDIHVATYSPTWRTFGVYSLKGIEIVETESGRITHFAEVPACKSEKEAADFMDLILLQTNQPI